MISFRKNLAAFYWMLYPRKPLFLPTFRSYFAQSRFYLYGLLWLRFLYFMIIHRGRVSVFSTNQGDHLSRVVHHNLKENFALTIFNRGRIESLLYVLKSIPSVRNNAKHARVLSIGPKNEGELLLLSSHGFKWQNLTGIDLFSYSPKIKVMDMHDMKFPDSSFDIICCSRVLSYSKGEEVKKAAKEIVRVCKNGGVVAIGIAWNENKGDPDYAGNRFDGWLDELYAYFTSNIDYIYWRSEDKKNDLGDMTTVFRIKK